MVLPKQGLTVRDPGIGVAANVDSPPIFTGIAHGGSQAVNTLGSISDPAQVRSVIGYGPLAEDVALALERMGGPVYFIIHNSSQVVALTAAAMTHTGTGVPTPTVSGSPNDRYALLITVVKGGTLGVSTFTFSLDAYDINAAPFTQSQERPTVASYVIPNTGLTVTFPAGTYVAGDTYALACVPQEPGTSDLGTVAALISSTTTLKPLLWAISGAQPDKTTGSAFAAAFQGYLSGLTSSFRFVRGFCDIGSDDSANNIDTGSSSWTAIRVCPAYGYTIRAVATGMAFEGWSNRKTSMVSGLAVRAMSELISSDISRTAAGPDDGVLKIFFDGFADQRIDADQISTMRTWPGISGFYFSNAKLKCPFGSDFTDLQFGRIMDVACYTVYQAQFPFQSATFRALTDGSGKIDPRDAAGIEHPVQNALDANLKQPTNASGTPGHVSDVVYAVDLTTNIVSSQKLRSTVAIVPLGYAKDIETDLFFTLGS